jgi:hypothetical protein
MAHDDYRQLADNRFRRQQEIAGDHLLRTQLSPERSGDGTTGPEARTIAAGHCAATAAWTGVWLQGQTGDAMHAALYELLYAAGYGIRSLMLGIVRLGLKRLLLHFRYRLLWHCRNAPSICAFR